jgi:hypothetical protein
MIIACTYSWVNDMLYQLRNHGGLIGCWCGGCSGASLASAVSHGSDLTPMGRMRPVLSSGALEEVRCIFLFRLKFNSLSTRARPAGGVVGGGESFSCM